DVREHFVAAVGARRDDRVEAVRTFGNRRRPRGGRVRPVELDRVHVAAERLRERHCLQRELVVRLDEDEDCHVTPSFCITSTTAGAASAPCPSTSACLPAPSGRTSLSFSSLDAGRETGRASTGLRFARSLAGTDG